MTEFRVDVLGDSEKQRALEALGVLVRDLRPFWPAVVPLFVGWMRQQFESEGAWGGASWAPLTPAYAAWKAKHYPGRSILYREGKLRQAASRPGRFPTATTLTLSIDDPKAGYHQDGTTKMVARPIVPKSLPSSARVELDRAADAYIDEIVRRVGLS